MLKYPKQSRSALLRHRFGLNSEYTFREPYKGDHYVKCEFPSELISLRDYSLGVNPPEEDELLNDTRWSLNLNQHLLIKRQNKTDRTKL